MNKILNKFYMDERQTSAGYSKWPDVASNLRPLAKINGNNPPQVREITNCINWLIIVLFIEFYTSVLYF